MTILVSTMQTKIELIYTALYSNVFYIKQAVQPPKVSAFLTETHYY